MITRGDQARGPHAERTVIGATLAGAAVFTGCVVASWDKPLVGDMIPYLWWARAIVETGVPVAVFNADDPPYPGNLHPPLYAHLIAVSFRFFGDGVRSAIYVNLVAFAATLILAHLLARRFFGGRLAGWLCTALLLVHPFAIQSTLLPDTDTSILPLAVMGYAVLWLTRPRLGPGWLFVLGLAFGVCLWTKFATPLVLPAVTGLLLALCGRPGGGVVAATVIGGVGLAFFVGTHYVYAGAAGLDPWVPMAWPLSKAHEDLSLNLQSRLGNILPTLKTDLLWYTPAFLALTAVGTGLRVARYARERVVRDGDFVWVLGWLIYLVYTVVIPTDGRPRYKTVTLVLFAIPVAGLLTAAIERIAGDGRKALFGAVMFGTAAAYYAAQPDLIATATLLAASPDTAAKVRLLVLHVLPIVLGGLVAAALLHRARGPALVLWVFLAFNAAAITIDVKHAREESPHNLFGIGLSGFSEAVDFIRIRARRDDVLLSFFDLPYYTRNPFYTYAEVTADRRYIDVERLRRLLARRPLKYWVFEIHRLRWPPAMYAAPEVQALLAQEFCLLRRFGNYYVYGSRRAGLCDGRA